MNLLVRDEQSDVDIQPDENGHRKSVDEEAIEKTLLQENYAFHQVFTKGDSSDPKRIVPE